MEELIQKVIPRYRWTARAVVQGLPSLAKKNIIVTGATSGIGFNTAAALARTGCNLTITARDEEKGRSAQKRIVAETGNPNVHVRPLKLGSYESCAEFAEQWRELGEPVDVLLHNAGVMASPYVLTNDGEEQQLQVNFLSVVLLTELLRPHLSPNGSRVVIVSSSAHKRGAGKDKSFMDAFRGYCPPDGARTPESRYEKWSAYAIAKSAQIMYANQLDAEFAEAHQVGGGGGTAESGGGLIVRPTANSVHPGGILTGLQKSLSKEEMKAMGWLDKDGNAISLFKRHREGAATSAWAAVSPEMTGFGGWYLENCNRCPKDMFGTASTDPEASLLAKIAGTAPHVWHKEDCAEVANAARSRLRAKGFLK